ncbi:unnamed protein product [Nippostrongylus brasiliensis]|uniref:DUF3969 family protein n=1 Tax=Nippostrongylus brasiliensis TaxID=27835 RepID=A0A0N4XEA3_NIPBR|nr:unnamed protein product [Nippostrongylus brasiliensis]
MVDLQVFMLAALIASDRTAKNLQCAYGESIFCTYVKYGYKLNKEAVDLMRSSESSFREEKERVLRTNQAIMKVLREEDKEKLLELLRIALELETSALFHLRVRCTGSKSGKAVCIKGIEDLYQATYSLVLAIMRIAEGEPLEAIRKADEKFREEYRNQSNLFNESALAYDLGRETLRTLETIETKLE